MISVNLVEIDINIYTAVRVELRTISFLMISNDVGYIMCGALDVDLLNEMLSDRKVVAGRALGVRTIDDLLHAPLEKVTNASKEYGWEVGMTGKDALNRLT